MTQFTIVNPYFFMHDNRRTTGEVDPGDVVELEPQTCQVFLGLGTETHVFVRRGGERFEVRMDRFLDAVTPGKRS